MEPAAHRPDHPAHPPKQNHHALYPGTFDPITNGHLGIIRRGLRIFDRITVLVAVNVDKKPLFDAEERCRLIRDCFPESDGRVTVDTTGDLIVNYAKEHGVHAIIRGLRAVSDFDYEFQLALMNRRLAPQVETVFLMTGFRWIYISSSSVKNAARFHGAITGLVPPHVEEALKAKFA